MCTPDELREAQSLLLRKRLGGGSKWRTLAVLALLLSFLLVMLFVEVHKNPSAWYEPYLFAAIFIGSAVYVFWKRRTSSKKPGATNLVEITPSSVTLTVDAFKSNHPWSAFSECLESENLFVLLDRPKWVIFVLPKRAFPDEGSQNWFRHLAERPADSIPVKGGMPQPLTGEAVSLEFQLRLSDYFDRTLASWQTWGIVWGMVCFIIGASIYASMTAGPNPVNSPAKVFFLVVIPFMLVMAGMIVSVFSVKAWQSHRKFLVPQKLALLESGIHHSSVDGVSDVPWTAYRYYKETKRSFILWRGQLWYLIPKRAFKSNLEQQNCLSLLRRNLRKSRWFFG